ncbi:glycosyltransferase family 9 protein [Pseudodesulfovibrio sp. JC047]|uniref:glycosyltransferase family 9 protein n=1 Tax=Pseudodesulfovibrio sp. JC047 TaxID=2683199 RepID=UPI0013D79BCB|nr:glycosyltransferase family 9 protein [Pseudodesulfovibrio sp. JC047]NDV19026.1 glycosyltransferase family 9 protein [Pseudodesulfovibrio sp. JC047]
MNDITNIAPQRILACQLRQIGDVVLATPSFRLLKERYPEAKLDVLTEKKCASVLENNPHINHVWTIDKKALRNPLTALRYYRKVGKSGYDLIVDFQQLPRCKWVVRFSDAPVRLTFTPPWYNRHLYSHWSTPLNGYAAKCKASVLRPLGIEWNGEPPEVFFTDAEKQWASEFVQSQGMQAHQFVTIDPSHRRITRKWPERHFAGLIKLIHAQYPKLKFFILYGPGELPVAEEVGRLAGEGVVISQKMLSLREMAAVQSQATLHIGNCSAPRHLAVAVNTPSLVIHGATGLGWKYPSDEHVSVDKGLPCHFCNKNQCKTRECLETFHPEECIDEALRLIGNRLDTHNEDEG